METPKLSRLPQVVESGLKLEVLTLRSGPTFYDCDLTNEYEFKLEDCQIKQLNRSQAYASSIYSIWRPVLQRFTSINRMCSGYWMIDPGMGLRTGEYHRAATIW